MSRHIGLPVVWVVVAISAVGCGVDEDALICAPGRTRDGDTCVDVEPEDAGDTTEDTQLPLEDGPCFQYFQCDPPYFCDTGQGTPGLCRLRCDVATAPPCAEGLSCTRAGACLENGGLALEAPCGESLGRCDARQDVGCPAEGQAVCRPICDLHAPTRDCRNDEVCQAQPAGHGLCVPN